MTPIYSRQVTIGTEPTLIYPPDIDGCIVVLRLAGQVNDVYVGGPDVTIETGFELTSDMNLELELNPDEALYGVVAEDTSKVYIIGAKSKFTE